MRGSPLVRAFIALLVMLALGIPLQRLLRAEQSAVAPELKTEAERTVHLEMEFTTPPESFRVLALGKELWREAEPKTEASRDLKLLFPKEGIDLQFECTWPGEVRAAARVRLTDADGAEHQRVIWGQGATSEVLTFP